VLVVDDLPAKPHRHAQAAGQVEAEVLEPVAVTRRWR